MVLAQWDEERKVLGADPWGVRLGEANRKNPNGQFCAIAISKD
jgi:hypothetical protein